MTGAARALACACLAVLVAALVWAFARPRVPQQGRETYLIYPYLDLDAPGERGTPYALAKCPGRWRGEPLRRNPATSGLRGPEAPATWWWRWSGLAPPLEQSLPLYNFANYSRGIPPPSRTPFNA